LIDVLEFHGLIGQQSQRPPLKAIGGITATQGDKMSFQFAIHFFLVDSASFPAVEGDIETIDHEPLLDPIDFPHADAEHAGDLLVCGALFLMLPLIAGQEDQGIENFLGPVFPL
jgi:hypothetical protein